MPHNSHVHNNDDDKDEILEGCMEQNICRTFDGKEGDCVGVGRGEGSVLNRYEYFRGKTLVDLVTIRKFA